MRNKLLFTLPFLFVLVLVILGLSVGAEAVVIVFIGSSVLAFAAMIGEMLVEAFGD